jgi:hypothetical protein
MELVVLKFLRAGMSATRGDSVCGGQTRDDVSQKRREKWRFLRLFLMPSVCLSG